MAISSRALDVEARRARAERILDAAGELLLKWGYKRVTIDDVAAQAGIGKGTVYLHWTTREALFHSLVEREITRAIEDLLATLHDVPETALLHRLIGAWFRIVRGRPLVQATVCADLDVLGKMAKGADHTLDSHLMGAFRDYLQLCVEQGVVRTDIPRNELVYALRATVRGFFLTEALAIDPSELDLERKSELLSATVQRAFEVPPAPSPEVLRILTDRVTSLFSTIAEHLRGQLRQAYE